MLKQAFKIGFAITLGGIVAKSLASSIEKFTDWAFDKATNMLSDETLEKLETMGIICDDEPKCKKVGF